mgnify:CR=1 FL=1
MRTGQQVQRGALNPAKSNNAYLDEVQQKFAAPKSEFKMEAFLKEITPRNHVKRAHILQFIANKVKTLRDLGRWEEAAAWEHWRSEIQIKSFEGKTDAEFVSDFQSWLLGHGKEIDHQKTPWYRSNCSQHDKQVKAYITSLFEAKMEFIRELNMLVVKARTTGLTGINEFYLYFKYIVKGNWENVEADFMYDFNRLLNVVDATANQNETLTDEDKWDRWQKGFEPAFVDFKSNIGDFKKAVNDFAEAISLKKTSYPPVLDDNEELVRSVEAETKVEIKQETTQHTAQPVVTEEQTTITEPVDLGPKFDEMFDMIKKLLEKGDPTLSLQTTSTTTLAIPALDTLTSQIQNVSTHLGDLQQTVTNFVQGGTQINHQQVVNTVNSLNPQHATIMDEQILKDSLIQLSGKMDDIRTTVESTQKLMVDVATINSKLEEIKTHRDEYEKRMVTFEQALISKFGTDTHTFLTNSEQYISTVIENALKHKGLDENTIKNVLTSVSTLDSKIIGLSSDSERASLLIKSLEGKIADYIATATTGTNVAMEKNREIINFQVEYMKNWHSKVGAISQVMNSLELPDKDKWTMFGKSVDQIGSCLPVLEQIYKSLDTFTNTSNEMVGTATKIGNSFLELKMEMDKNSEALKGQHMEIQNTAVNFKELKKDIKKFSKANTKSIKSKIAALQSDIENRLNFLGSESELAVQEIDPTTGDPLMVFNSETDTMVLARKRPPNWFDLVAHIPRIQVDMNSTHDDTNTEGAVDANGTSPAELAEKEAKDSAGVTPTKPEKEEPVTIESVMAVLKEMNEKLDSLEGGKDGENDDKDLDLIKETLDKYFNEDTGVMGKFYKDVKTSYEDIVKANENSYQSIAENVFQEKYDTLSDLLTDVPGGKAALALIKMAPEAKRIGSAVMSALPNIGNGFMEEERESTRLVVGDFLDALGKNVSQTTPTADQFVRIGTVSSFSEKTIASEISKKLSSYESEYEKELKAIQLDIDFADDILSRSTNPDELFQVPNSTQRLYPDQIAILKSKKQSEKAAKLQTEKLAVGAIVNPSKRLEIEKFAKAAVQLTKNEINWNTDNTDENDGSPLEISNVLAKTDTSGSFFVHRENVSNLAKQLYEMSDSQKVYTFTTGNKTQNGKFETVTITNRTLNKMINRKFDIMPTSTAPYDDTAPEQRTDVTEEQLTQFFAGITPENIKSLKSMNLVKQTGEALSKNQKQWKYMPFTEHLQDFAKSSAQNAKVKEKKAVKQAKDKQFTEDEKNVKSIAASASPELKQSLYDNREGISTPKILNKQTPQQLDAIEAAAKREMSTVANDPEKRESLQNLLARVRALKQTKTSKKRGRDVTDPQPNKKSKTTTETPFNPRSQ